MKFLAILIVSTIIYSNAFASQCYFSIEQSNDQYKKTDVIVNAIIEDTDKYVEDKIVNGLRLGSATLKSVAQAKIKVIEVIKGENIPKTIYMNYYPNDRTNGVVYSVGDTTVIGLNKRQSEGMNASFSKYQYTALSRCSQESLDNYFELNAQLKAIIEKE